MGSFWPSPSRALSGRRTAFCKVPGRSGLSKPYGQWSHCGAGVAGCRLGLSVRRLALVARFGSCRLGWEERQPERFELAAGVVRLMVGGTEDHGRIGGNIFAALCARLRGKLCSAHGSSLKQLSRSMGASMYSGSAR
jgi:hypothetical protein